MGPLREVLQAALTKRARAEEVEGAEGRGRHSHRLFRLETTTWWRRSSSYFAESPPQSGPRWKPGHRGCRATPSER